MTEDAPTPSTSAEPDVRPGRGTDLVAWATRLGLLLAAVGLIDGLVMALKKKVAPCPDGKYFPEGTTDFNCYGHPQGGIGIAVAVFSVLLGILVVFSSIVATASLEDRPRPQ